MFPPALSFCSYNKRMYIHVCAWRLRVRTVLGQWEEGELPYLNHSRLYCTHGICPACVQKIRRELELEQTYSQGETHA